MRRMTPRKLLNVSLVVVFVLLVLPLYAIRGLNDSLDHARGTGTVGGIDFKAYYIAADMLRWGEDFYDVRQQAEQVQARGLPLNESYYIYPPLLAIVFVPLTALPMQQAAQVWFFLNMALYGLCLVVISRALKLSRHSEILPLLWILAFLFPPALFTLYKGQVNIVILLLLVVTYWLCARDRQVLAGLTLGVATMIKIVPVLLLPYAFWRRKYTLGLTALGTILIVGILGLVIVGAGPHRTFLASVLPSLAQPRPNPANQSLGGFLSLLLVENPYADPLVRNPSLWRALTLSGSALLVLGVVLVLWHGRARTSRTDLEFALIVATLPLVSNIGWVDLFVLLVFPYAVLLKHALQGRMRMRWKVSSIISAVCISFPRLQDLFTNLVARDESLLRNPVSMGLPFFGLILLWAATAAALWESPDRESHLGLT
jgi:4-amino-4-deoxy-L-arabinose transferase-like glycosyltransferase